MDETTRTAAISPLRQRLFDDMNMRRISRTTQYSYVRDVGRFAAFLRRSPDTATADDVRRFQIEQRCRRADADDEQVPVGSSRCSSHRFICLQGFRARGGGCD